MTNDSRSVKSSRNVIYGYIGKTVGLILTFVSRTVFIKVFGVEMLGISGLFSNVLAFLSLADLGFSTAMTYSYYKPIAENDEAKIAALNRFYKKIYIVIAIGIFVVGIALMPFLKHIINLEKEIDHIYLYYFLTLMGTVVSYLFVYKTTILYAHQEGYVVVNYNMIMNAVSAVVQIVLMLVFKSYVVYLCVVIVFTLINNFYVSHVADKKYKYIKTNKSELPKEDRKDIFSNIGSVFLYKVSSVLMNSTDNIIISKLIGTVIVGYYTNYLTVINMITSYITITFNSLTASIGNLIAKESNDKQFKVFKEVQTVSAWFCLVIVPCVYALLDDFIVIWLGKSFLLDKKTLIAIIINFFLICILNPIWIFREAAGIYRKTKYIMLICAALNIIFSIVLGKLIGLSGILFASALAKLCTYIWYEPIILFRGYFKMTPLLFFKAFVLITLGSVSVCGVLSYIHTFIALSGIIGFIVKGAVFFALTNALYLIIYFRSPYFKSLMSRGKNMVLKILKKA